jgi:hypothetical protein
MIHNCLHYCLRHLIVGGELLVELVATVNPASIVRLIRPTESQAAAAEAEDSRLERDLESKGRKVHTLVSAAKGKMSSGQSAAQRRELQCLNYFDLALSKRFGPYDVASHGTAVAKGLQGLFPYRVHFDEVSVAFTDPAVPKALALEALNGSLVALAVSDNQPRLCEERSDGLRVLSEAPCAACVGLGLVRAIDPSAGIFFILTPVEIDELQRVDLLIKGRIETPTVMLGEDPALAVPYLAADVLSKPEGGGSQHTRKNILRRKHAH